jgi:hypothetical protein
MNKNVSAKRRNDENITKTPKSRHARMCAYTRVSEGNAFKIDSENADEIVKG